MHKWKFMIITGLIGVVLAGCNSQQNTVKNIDTPQENQNPPSVTGIGEQEQRDDTKKDRIYVNQTDAWMVELPPSWSDVHVVETGRMTEFIFPSENPELQQALFWITAISEEEWKKAQSEGPTGTAKELTHKDGDVYLYYTPLDMVLDGKELKRYEEMVKDIPTIIKSFKFE